LAVVVVAMRAKHGGDKAVAAMSAGVIFGVDE
jgi:hypothetical protein